MKLKIRYFVSRVIYQKIIDIQSRIIDIKSIDCYIGGIQKNKYRKDCYKTIKVAEEFVKMMESNNIRVDHQVVGEEDKTEYICTRFSGKNFSSLVFYLVFDQEGSNSAQMFCNEICRFEESKNLIMLQTVNALNAKYRWVTFFVSENREVNANMSVSFTDDASNQLLMNYLEHFMGVIDTAYPVLMKALYA